MEALRTTVAEMARHETGQLLDARGGRRPDLSLDAVSATLATVAAMLALLGFAFLLRAPPRCARPGRGDHRGAGRAAADHAREHRRRRHHHRRRRARVTNLNAVAESLTGWSSAEAVRASRSSGCSDRQRVEPRAGREPGDSRPARRPGRRPGEPHPADQERRRRDADRRQRRADPGRRRRGPRLRPGLSRHQREEGQRARARARRGRACSASSPTWRSRPWSTPRTARSSSSTAPGPTITGYAADELTTLPEWTQRAYGARAAMMNTVIGALFDLTESIDNGEREITTASGEKRIWHFITAPIGRDERGRRMLVTNAIDVTERRRLDAVARRQRSADAPGDGRRRTTAAGSGIGRAARWSGATRRASCSAIGADEPVSFEQFQLHIHPDDRERRERAIAAAWTSGVHGNEYRIVRPDGEVRWLSSRGRVVRGADGSERMLGVVGDITEQKQPGRRAAGRRPRARTSSSPRSRTSCATRSRRCATRSRSCSARVGDPATFDKASGVMERQLGQLVRLIDDLLDVSRISRGKLDAAHRGDRPGGDRRARGRGVPAGGRARRPRARGAACRSEPVASARRPGAPGAGVRQPARQRLQVHARRRPDRRRGAASRATAPSSRCATTASASTPTSSTASSRCSRRSTTRSSARTAASASA